MAGSQGIQQGLAFDARALDSLRRDASRDPQETVRKAAGQFEALFMQQLLKSMRDAMPKSGMLDSPGQQTYVGMLDQQLSQSLANRVGGLADMIAKQLTRHMGSSSAANEDSGSAGKVGAPASFLSRPSSFPMPSSFSPPTRSSTAMAASAKAARLAQPAPSLDPQAAERLKASLSRRLDGPQAAFVDRMWPHALAAQRETGVAAAFVVGQAALESGWGKHEIRHADGRSAHNLFGIKATGGWKGPTVDVTTTEYVDGQPKRMVERFRAYASYAEAFQDWARLMSASSRYGGVLREGQSVEGFAQGMQRAGYATDPRYGDKLENTINQTLLLKRLVV